MRVNKQSAILALALGALAPAVTRAGAARRGWNRRPVCVRCGQNDFVLIEADGFVESEDELFNYELSLEKSGLFQGG